MSKCTKIHFASRNMKPVPCYYVAGICIVDPIHQGTPELFLRATFPYHHGPTYEESKRAHSEMIPSNIIMANTSI